MSLLILPNRFKQQPQYPTSVDWSNPLTRGLVSIFNGAVGFGSSDLARGINLVLSGSGFNARSRQQGIAGGPAASSSYYTGLTPILDYPFTVFLMGSADVAATTGPAISIYKGGTGYIYCGFYSNFSTVAYPRSAINSSAGTSQINSTGSQLRNNPRVWALVARAINDYELFVDGVSAGTSSATGPVIDSSFTIGLGVAISNTYSSGGLSAGANIFLSGIYNRELSAVELTELTRTLESPWQLFKAPPHRLWVASAGGGGTTYNVSITEGINATDAPDSSAILNVSITEGINATDAPDSSAILNVSIIESINATDAPDSSAILNVTIAEGVDATDAPDGTVSTGHTYNVSITEGINATDAPDSSAILNVSITEGITGTDNQSFTGTFNLTIVEGVDVTDTLTLTGSFHVAVLEGINVTDLPDFVGAHISVTLPQLRIDGGVVDESIVRALEALDAVALDLKFNGFIQSETLIRVLNNIDSKSRAFNLQFNGLVVDKESLIRYLQQLSRGE